jgi:LmbE family N-acetylglucosaminyl deacetylase
MLLAQKNPRVLAIGAHPDDIELGMGGCVHRLVNKEGGSIHFLILTEGVQGPGVSGQFKPSQRRKEALRAAECLKVPPENVEVLTFPDCQLHEKGHEIIREIERRIFDASGTPRFDAIFTHSGEDTHADHRTAHESTLSAVRNFHGTVLCYQAPSTKPNGFHPTFFVKLEELDIDQKDAAIMRHVSQRDRPYTTVSRTVSMVANWSIFLRLPMGTYLEAFEVYKSFL